MSADFGDLVDVVVVNWNGLAHLRRCLPALAEQRYAAAQVIVVDNGSSDGSPAYLRDVWPAVRTVVLPTNTGFAAGANAGIAAGEAPWVALLNNDTVPEARWLATLVEAAARDRSIGAVASRMLFLDAPDTINSAGIAVDASGIAWDRLGGRPASAGETAAEVFGASAGAALFRRSALDDAAERDGDGTPACLDPTFFMYMEDVDLAWRLRLRGWRAVYAPDARVLHAGSASSVEGSPFKNRLLARNKLRTILKDYPGAPLIAHLPLILLYDLSSVPYRYLVQRQGAALAGRLEALRDLGRVLRQRRVIQSRRRASWRELSAVLEPLAPPWEVMRRYRHLVRRSHAGVGRG